MMHAKPERPVSFQGDLRNLPGALAPLTALPNWVGWKWEWRVDKKGVGKWTKPPVRPDAPGQYARNNDSRTWGSYEQAISAFEAGKCDGIGFCLAGSNISAFDLDKARDPATGNIALEAMGYVNRANSYTEVSVSGSGLHIIGTGSGDKVHRKQKIPGSNVEIESYRGAERYIVITGNPLPRTWPHIANIDGVIDDVVGELNGAGRKDEGFDFKQTKPDDEFASTLPNDLAELIDKGPSPQPGVFDPDKDRSLSAAFHHAVCWLKDLGWTVSRIERRIAGKPIVPERFAKRLREEIARCLHKAKPKEDRGQAQSTGIPLDFYEDFDKAVAKNWIIKGVIAKGETSSWVGPPGSGKSALLTNLVSHATEGMEWRGYRSKEKVGVVYFALERGQLVKRRLIAANGPPKLPIAVASQIINLLDPACVPVIVETIRTAEAHFGCPVGLIAFDTFNKGIAAGGGDEDKAKDQNTTFANLRRVHELVPVHIALIGHTGKDETRGARGSSAHPGDVDLMVQISVNGDTRTATITKINDGMEGIMTQFKLKPVILGEDEDGDPITTAIVSDDAVDDGAPQGAGMLRGRWPQSLRIFKAAVETAIIDHGKPMRPFGNDGPLVRTVRLIDIRSEFMKAYPANAESAEAIYDAKRKAFSRALKQGRDMGLIGSREIGGIDFIWPAT